MHHASSQGVDEHVINVHYYYHQGCLPKLHYKRHCSPQTPFIATDSAGPTRATETTSPMTHNYAATDDTAAGRQSAVTDRDKESLTQALQRHY